MSLALQLTPGDRTRYDGKLGKKFTDLCCRFELWNWTELLEGSGERPRGREAHVEIREGTLAHRTY